MERQKAINITSTIGIATAPDDRIADWKGMLDNADKALYRGKGMGKNAVVALRCAHRQNSAAIH